MVVFFDADKRAKAKGQSKLRLISILITLVVVLGKKTNETLYIIM